MIVNSFTSQEIEEKLCSIQENELSKKILIPLFEKIYKGSAQFTGGTLEKGKDILITKSDELGDIQYVAIQVKKVKINSNSQCPNNFQQLINQLSQARSEPVINSANGMPVYIDKLVFVTPYTIPQATLDNHQTAFRRFIDQHSCKIVDGSKLVALIRLHRPDLINTIFEPTHILTSSVRNKLKNSQLMSALDKHVSKDVSEIYCDISFFFGRAENGIKRLFKIASNHNEETIKIKVDDFEKYRKIHHTFLSLFGDELFELSSLENPELSKNEENLLRDELKALNYDINNVKAWLGDKIEEIGLNEANTKLMNNAMILSGNDYKVQLDDITSVAHSFTSTKRKVFNNATKKYRSKLNSLLNKSSNICEKLEKTHKNIIIKTGLLTNKINKELEDFVYSAPTKTDECHSLLVRMMQVQDIYSFTIDFPEIFREIELEANPNINRLDINLETVFKTGLNIAVLGEAGSGKTTSLQMYAKQLLMKGDDNFVIYISLVELGRYKKSGHVNILNSLVEYLQSIDIKVSEADVIEYLSLGSSVLLLDSIDEGIAVYPEIVKSLTKFVNLFQKCQVITSSRTSVLKGVLIPFNQVTLLPFNTEQLFSFISKWFKGDERPCIEINNHLDKNKELLKVVTNPLSATILCVLYENRVPLPKSESSLYRTRLELLAGKFDKEKMFARLTNPPSVIVEQAKLVGYEMHKLRVRDASTNAVLEILNKNGVNEGGVLQDFLSSEIMIHVSSSNLSFGHLRFQEFLASEEINNRRSFPTDKLLKDPWWVGPLILYAQTAREVDWIFNHAIANNYVFEAREILRSIASLRGEKDSKVLLNRMHISMSANEDE